MDEKLAKDARFWDGTARKYAKGSIGDEAGYERTLDAVKERLTQDHHVLEIGCGTGTTALRLAPNAGAYLATDYSSEMIAIGREKAAESPVPSLSFDVGEPVSADWPDGAYDRVLAFNVLHLLPNLDASLGAIHAKLKPGGLFISKTPCLSLMNPLIRLIIPVLQLIGKAPHVTALTPQSLETALETAGFTIIERDWHGSNKKDSRPYLVAEKA